MTREVEPAVEVPETSGRTMTGHSRWTRADIFRAALFGALGVLYFILLFPIAVITLVLLGLDKLYGRSSAGQDQAASSG
jgi:hypothetical protein